MRLYTAFRRLTAQGRDNVFNGFIGLHRVLGLALIIRFWVRAEELKAKDLVFRAD